MAYYHVVIGHVSDAGGGRFWAIEILNADIGEREKYEEQIFYFSGWYISPF